MKNRKPFMLNGRRFSFEVVPHNNQGRPPSYWVRDAAGNDVGLLHRQHLKHLAWDKYTFALSLDFQISATKLPYCATSVRIKNGTLPDKGLVIPVPEGFLEKHALIAQARANGTAFEVDHLPTGKGYSYGVVRGGSEETERRIDDFVRAHGHVSRSDARRMYKEALHTKGKHHTYTVALKKLVDSKPCKIPHVRMVRAAALKPGMRIPHYYKNILAGHDVVTDVVPAGWGVNVTIKSDHWVPGETLHDANRRYAAQPPFCRPYQADQVLPVFIEWRDKVAL